MHLNLLLPMVVGNYLYHDPKLAEEEEQRSWIEVAEGEQGSWIVVVVEAEEEHPTFRMKEDVVVEEEEGEHPTLQMKEVVVEAEGEHLTLQMKEEVEVAWGHLKY